MLRLVQSNKMEVLAELLIEQVRQHYLSGGVVATGDNTSLPLSRVLQPLRILVQSPGMAQWLKLRIAGALGIAANIEFPLPSSFIWELYRENIHDLPAQSAFTKPNMQWKLMKLLPQHLERPEFVQIKQYLSTEKRSGAVSEARKLFQLAGKIADVFDQYLVYRPDWIDAWQENNSGATLPGIMDASQQWQPILWQALVAYAETLGESPWHRANLHTRLLTTLKGHTPQHTPQHTPEHTQASTQGHTPTPVFIFGISAMPKQQLDIFQALSHSREVVMFWSNPCAQYWGDIVTEKQQSKKQLDLFEQVAQGQSEEQTEALLDSLTLYETGNPLLASWGKLGREFQDMLFAADGENSQIQVEDWFVDPPPANLLERLQNDVLTLSQPTPLSSLSEAKAHLPSNPSDHSIWVNSCHSKLRELEVLHDHLLHRLQADKTLGTGDIIVMMPNVADYAPYIDAVFGGATSEHFLSYAISDRSVIDESPLIKAFLQLLTLHQSRFTLTEVMELFAVPDVLQRFGVQENELDMLQHWLSQAGVRWGLSGLDKQRWDLPNESQNTWLFGLRRLLAGYALHQQADYCAASSDTNEWLGNDTPLDIVPFSELEGQQVEILGKFMMFLQQVEQVLHQAMTPATLAERISHASELLHSVFAVAESQQYFQQQILQALETLAAHSQQFPGDTDADVFAAAMQQELSSKGVGQRFLAGRINFCTLMPMRSVPFKQVCILGLNDPGYPRIVPPVGFDLMANQMPRRGDRSRRWDDRYLFLEAILSARSQLYLSYLGRDDRDNSPRAPSILLTELLQYCQRYQADFAVHGDTPHKTELVPVVAQPLQPFNPRYFVAGGDEGAAAKTAQDPHHSAQDRAQASAQNSIQVSFNPRWLQVLNTAEQSQEENPFAGQALLELPDSIPNEVSLAQLKACLRNASRFFFQQRWHTQFKPGTASEEDIEPLGLSSLSRFQMADQVLRANSADSTFRQLKLIGTLPVANLAQPATKALQQASSDVLKQIASAVPELDTHQPIQPQASFRDLNLDITLKQKSIRIFGRVNGLYPLNSPASRWQLLQWRPGKLRVIDSLSLWLDWLLLCATGSQQLSDVAVFVSRDSAIKLPRLTPQQASDLLAIYVQFWQQAHLQPLAFFPNSAWEWLQKQTEESAIKCYHGNQLASGGMHSNDFAKPEGADLHFQRTCPDLRSQMAAFQYWAQQLLGALHTVLTNDAD